MIRDPSTILLEARSIDDVPRAIERYTAAINLSGGTNPNMFRERGQLLLKLGKLDEAINDFRQALQLDKGYIDCYKYLGEALVRKGRVKMGYRYIKKYQKMLEALGL